MASSLCRSFVDGSDLPRPMSTHGQSEICNSAWFDMHISRYRKAERILTQILRAG
jgi:hypothetical protein